MLQSMCSGISGLKVNQEELNVIGNNIANSDTTSYKAQRTRFEDMISQTINQATMATTNMGGTNNTQVGLGVKLAGIDTLTGTGNMQTTSNPTDVAVDGTGYFIVGSGPVPSTSGTTGTGMIGIDSTNAASPVFSTSTASGVTSSFTRDGSFSLDSQGNLLTSDGLRVYGYPNDNAVITYGSSSSSSSTSTANSIAVSSDTTAINPQGLVPLVIPQSVTGPSGTSLAIQSYSIGKDGVITATLSDSSQVALGQIAMTSFSNAPGLTKTGNNDYQVSANSGQAVLRTNSGSTTDNSAGYGNVLQGMLEMSNVDLSTEFSNMIVASRAFQANGKIITTGDELLQTLVNLKNS